MIINVVTETCLLMPTYHDDVNHSEYKNRLQTCRYFIQ